MHQRQSDARQWLTKKSISIDPDVGEDALQDWFHKLLRLPWHQRVQKIGATCKAIQDGAHDIRDKGSKYEHIPFDDDLTNTIPDKSRETPNDELITDEYYRRLLEPVLKSKRLSPSAVDLAIHCEPHWGVAVDSPKPSGLKTKSLSLI